MCAARLPGPNYRVNGLMPTYRTPHGFVHIKMTNTKKRPAPLPCCARISSTPPFTGTVQCRAISSILCDWPVEGGTCDAPLCVDHAHAIGPDRHLCGLHFALHGGE